MLKRVGGFRFIDNLYLYTISGHTLIYKNFSDFSFLISQNRTFKNVIQY